MLHRRSYGIRSKMPKLKLIILYVYCNKAFIRTEKGLDVSLRVCWGRGGLCVASDRVRSNLRPHFSYFECLAYM